MQWSTNDITLSLGIDYNTLSPECLSTLIDLWGELQTNSVEALQTGTSNIFAFAETCAVFAVILENPKPTGDGKAKALNSTDNMPPDARMRNYWDEKLLQETISKSKRDMGGDRASSSTTKSSPGIRPSSSLIAEQPPAPEVSEPDLYDRFPKESLRQSAHGTGAGNASSSTAGPIHQQPPSASFNTVPPLPTSPFNLDADEDDDIYEADIMDSISSYPISAHDIIDIRRPANASPVALIDEVDLNVHSKSLSSREEWKGDQRSDVIDTPYTAPTERYPTHYPEIYQPYSNPYSVGSQDCGKKAVGIVYLSLAAHQGAPAGEGNIGAILAPWARGKGFAKQAVELVLEWAFDLTGLHRVQAGLIDSGVKDKALSLFTQMGFVHEGTRRRAVFDPDTNGSTNGGWKDVTYLALLETDWLMRAYLKPAPKNIWDEMFLRHAREREELLRWDERQQRLKRTLSMETVRMGVTDSDVASTADEYEDDPSGTQTPSAHSSSIRRGKKRRISPEFENVSQRASSPPLSDSEMSSTSDSSWDLEGWESDEHPESVLRRSASVASSHWDTGSLSGSSSGFESLGDTDEE